MTWFEVISIVACVMATLGGALAAVIWFLMRKMIDDLEDLEKDMASHKLYSLNTFAKDSDVKGGFDKINTTMNTIQQALNTNTNMTGVIMEKISTLSEKLNHRKD